MHIPSGRAFIEEGTPAHDFYVLTDGRVKLFNLLPDGRRQIAGFARRGDFLGLAAAKNYAFSAEALGDVMLCRFSHSSIERLTERFPRLQQRLRDEASRELIQMQRRLVLLGRKTARERLATFLVEQSCSMLCRKGRDQLTVPDGPVLVNLAMPRTDIADYLGLTIETVSRTFGLFKKERLITVRGITGITLLEPYRLVDIAEGLG
ncbi:helix-turn-helix domain-containing protein [Saccharibacter sp. 17.LH.SD]|uniref:Crp/Fnr family transcriptional regulator n=1 Tax=Saccharibacter sp. 17.LH.SD TaxID=2689393 RepID=UPI00136D585D|nr:helix-turn-helix domain-containing protein [Saccharibacter sp. 17.LH.SD]